ncbi:unnamed protein product [Phytophthora fragariaefolia]|uniref:Unnamed protein product n=1 Tax=Phytophthora fragariaefolia TaxID=1490495 RepID=A0A9W6U962_9STRA|nr:unnamed protein product [Phytophthora fragariaefolia]
MMGRRLRAPNELLRTRRVMMIGKWATYHQKLVKDLDQASGIAEVAIRRDQERRERYYNQRVRQRAHFAVGDLVRILKPPRGRGVTKLAHQWIGPARINADAGFDNWRVARLDMQNGLVLALEEDEVDGNGNGDGDGAERPRDLVQQNGEDDGTIIERHNTDGARTGGRAASGSIGSLGDREPGTAPPELTIRSQPEITNTVVGSGLTLGQQAISRSEDAVEKSTAIRQTASRHSESREGRAARRGVVRDEQASQATSTIEADANTGVSIPAGTIRSRATDPDIESNTGGTNTTGGSEERRSPNRNEDEQQETVRPALAGKSPETTGSAGALRGLGQTRWVHPLHHLLETAARGTVVGRARRRLLEYANKAGRYVLQYQVVYGSRLGGSTTTEWISAREFEKLFDDGKIGDDLLAGVAGGQVVLLTPEQQETDTRTRAVVTSDGGNDEMWRTPNSRDGTKYATAADGAAATMAIEVE